jgi:hypothetical protein
MPITLAQARLLTQDKLAQQIIDEFRQDQLLNAMIFDNSVSMNGGGTLAYTYNRVTTLPTAGFREINSEFTPSEASTTQYTANLKVFGGAFQVDRVIQNNVRGITDQVTFQLQQKIKATKALFSDSFINGDSAVEAKAFDGIDKAITGSSTELIPDASIDLSTSALIDTNWKLFLDYLRRLFARLDGSATQIHCNSTMFSVFQSVADRAASMSVLKNELGQEVLNWNGVPIVKLGDKPGTSNPIVPIGATSGETSLYVERIGLDGVHGVSPAGDELIKQYLPNMNLPGAVKTGEVEMVAAIALKATRAAGVLRKIKVQ